MTNGKDSLENNELQRAIQAGRERRLVPAPPAESVTHPIEQRAERLSVPAVLVSIVTIAVVALGVMVLLRPLI